MTEWDHAISGLKVVDLSRVLGGPYCTQILADHGADVIKVEPPAGDETRYWGPPFADGIASYFIGVNRNKRSLVLDLKSEDGRAVLLKLIAGADILIENFKPGGMEHWGLGYHQRLAGDFPRLIYCRVSGYGGDGPLGGFPGYDAVLQAMSGLMNVNGDATTGPMRLGVPVVDIATGLYAAIGILMAVIERQRSGLGQFLDQTLFDAAHAVMHPYAANYFLSGRDPVRVGSAHPNISPYDKFATRTGEIFLAIGNDRAFQTLCERLGMKETAADPRFRTNGDRVVNRLALRDVLEARMADEDGEALCMDLLAIGLPAGPVLTTSAALASPQAEARGTVLTEDGYRGISTPLRFSRSPAAGVKIKPPQLGEHSREILAEHGIDAAEIETLIKSGVVKTP